MSLVINSPLSNSMISSTTVVNVSFGYAPRQTPVITCTLWGPAQSASVGTSGSYSFTFTGGTPGIYTATVTDNYSGHDQATNLQL